MKSVQLSRRDSLALLGAAALVPAVQAQGEPRAGQHFRKLAQRLPGGGAKIEVVEFFWYGCPHCDAFESQLNPWIKQLPANVEFKHVHVGGLAMMRPHQRLYFTLDAMKVEHQFRASIFDAIHRQRQQLDTPEAMVKLLQPLGLDVAKFNSTWAAFDPKAFSGARISQANKLAEAYAIEGVPTLGIGGLYQTSPTIAAGGERLPEIEGGRRALIVADHLIRNFGKV